MSKVLDATCNAASIVTSEGVPIPGAVILSEGKQQSSGVLIIDGDKYWYVASSATDIKETLTQVIAALTEIATTLTAIGAGMTGPTTAPPVTLATSVATINAKVALLTTLKGALK